MTLSRRDTLLGGAAVTLAPLLSGNAKVAMTSTDLILVNAKVTTLDRANPEAEAVAIRDGKFLAVGSEKDVRAAAAPNAIVIDADQAPLTDAQLRSLSAALVRALDATR